MFGTLVDISELRQALDEYMTQTEVNLEQIMLL